MRIEALVLAAGSSRRMGPAQKLLTLVAGKPLIRHVIDAVRGAGFEPVVVLGPVDSELQTELRDCRTIANPNHADGMGSSLAFGIRSLPPCDAIVITLGDQFGVSVEVLRELAAQATPERIIRVRYPNSDIPHPVLFPAKFRDELEAISGDEGAKSLLQRHSHSVGEITGEVAPIDVDAPEDLDRLRAQWK